MAAERDPECRAIDPYTTSNVSKAGLVEETRLYLLTHAKTQDMRATYHPLIVGALAQRARETHKNLCALCALCGKKAWPSPAILPRAVILWYNDDDLSN